MFYVGEFVRTADGTLGCVLAVRQELRSTIVTLMTHSGPVDWLADQCTKIPYPEGTAYRLQPEWVQLLYCSVPVPQPLYQAWFTVQARYA
jgi:hypothetical protein